MRFPGLSEKPAVYVVGSDGSERLARQHAAGDFVVVEEIAPHFRLRLGPNVLDIINTAYDPAGKPTGTGTTAPTVERDILQAKSPMSEFHASDEWEEDEEPEPLPVWRRREMAADRARRRGAAGVPLHPRQAAARAGGPEGGRAVHRRRGALSAGEAGARRRPRSRPPMLRQKRRRRRRRCRPFRGQLPMANAPPVRPAMLSYAVPHSDGPKPAAAPGPREGRDPPQTGLAFQASSLPGVKASPAIDDTYQLMPGLLPCVLDTAIQSDLPGPLLCHLPGPVYSPKGVLLMEAGTQVIGRYQSMGRNGESRLMAVSTYAHTPNGIWVPLAGNPMADDLGRSGFAGAVDNHYLERFGGAVILSLTQSGLGILQAAVSKGGNTYISTDSANNLAEQILQSQINIAPTFSKHQGETIAIWLTTPIDFSDSYRIRQVRQ